MGPPRDLCLAPFQCSDGFCSRFRSASNAEEPVNRDERNNADAVPGDVRPVELHAQHQPGQQVVSRAAPVVMEQLTGRSLSSVSESLRRRSWRGTKGTRRNLCRLHTVTGELFGYPRPDGHTRSRS